MELPGVTAPSLSASFRRASKRKRRSRSTLASVIALAVFGLLFYFFDGGAPPSGHLATGDPSAAPSAESRATAPASSTRARVAANAQRIREAFEHRQGGFFVACEGTVTRLLPDDNDGSRHQCFLLRLANGHSLKIAHNIDVASPASIAVGDTVAFRGEYQWNSLGGVIHWTHHDPSRKRAGGWLEVNGRRYQ